MSGGASSPAGAGRCRRIGVVVHPTRDVEEPIRELVGWAQASGVEVGQIAFGSGGRHAFAQCNAADRDLIVAIGGDGTTLSAIHSAAPAQRPVLGVACGSLGALTVVGPDRVASALDRFVTDDWVERQLPALLMTADGEQPKRAFNDIVVARRGEGQVRVTARVDDVLFARFAGDGCVVGTPVGSSAYTMAAGGPLLPLDIDAFVLTALPSHGGFRPPLVLAADSSLELEITSGYGGARLEVDGQLRELQVDRVTIRAQRAAARLVTFPDRPPFLKQLRDRGIISDSPRILAEDERVRDQP